MFRAGGRPKNYSTHIFSFYHTPPNSMLFKGVPGLMKGKYILFSVKY